MFYSLVVIFIARSAREMGYGNGTCCCTWIETRDGEVCGGNLFVCVYYFEGDGVYTHVYLFIFSSFWDWYLKRCLEEGMAKRDFVGCQAQHAGLINPYNTEPQGMESALGDMLWGRGFFCIFATKFSAQFLFIFSPTFESNFRPFFKPSHSTNFRPSFTLTFFLLFSNTCPPFLLHRLFSRIGFFFCFNQIAPFWGSFLFLF